MSGRIGVFGGTFDPPHIAHLILAERARDVLTLDKVLWVPVGDPPHKAGEDITLAQHRITMIERAIAGNPYFQLSRIDVERSGPHYTVDMLRLLADRYPAAALYFLIGGDSLRDLSRWHQPERLIEHAKLAVVERPGITYDFDQLEAAIPGLADRVIRIDVPRIEISATDVREYVNGHHSIRYLVSPAVAEYIADHDLYRQ